MSESASSSGTLSGAEAPAGRWAQLWLGVLCMMLIANLQYAWTLFVGPIREAHGWSLADIQWAFTIFIATETWITPFAGYAVDHMGPRRGPKLMILLGGIAVGAGLGAECLRRPPSHCSTSAPRFPDWAPEGSTRPVSGTP